MGRAGILSFVWLVLLLLLIFIALFVALPLIGLAAWALISVAVVGIIIGGLARLVLPGRQNIGVIATILLGWIGSIVGGFIGFHILSLGTILSVLIEIGVAAALIALYVGWYRERHPGFGR